MITRGCEICLSTARSCCGIALEQRQRADRAGSAAALAIVVPVRASTELISGRLALRRR